METPNRSALEFFYENPLLFPGVTVRRTSYETLGGFRPDLGFVADWEMWARISDDHGAVISRNPLTFYRFYTGNATWQCIQTAEEGRSTMRLSEIFAKRYSGFCLRTAQIRTAAIAWQHYNKFKSSGDEFAANANRELWKELTPFRQRAARHLKEVIMPVVRTLTA